jgi:superfamily II DNA or RNA helicase
MMIRDQRQKEFANDWWNKGQHGILNLCPRFGKVRTSINILEKFEDEPSVLIAYPDKQIKQSWIDDFETREYTNSNITYTTHLSLHKHKDQKYDIVIIDEVHLLSNAQIDACKDLLEINDRILALTGTLTSKTEDKLAQELDLFVVAYYPIEQAINEGVIVDYQIFVVETPLDKVIINDYKGKKRTEKKQFDAYTWVINRMEEEFKNTMFQRLARMRIIQNSIAKRDVTRSLLNKWKQERILVFCGVTAIADSLGIPSYHSKSTEKQIFTDFVEGKGNHLAVVKIGNTGVTYKPLNKVIINYFDSNGQNLAQKINRCMAMEYNNPDKKAYIYIISTNEEVERKWLKKALEFFDKSKIKYV